MASLNLSPLTPPVTALPPSPRRAEPLPSNEAVRLYIEQFERTTVEERRCREVWTRVRALLLEAAGELEVEATPGVTAATAVARIKEMWHLGGYLRMCAEVSDAKDLCALHSLSPFR